MSFFVPYEETSCTAVLGDKDSKSALLEEYKDENPSSLSDPENGQAHIETPGVSLKQTWITGLTFVLLVTAPLVGLMNFFASDELMQYIANSRWIGACTLLSVLICTGCMSRLRLWNPNSMAQKTMLIAYLLSYSVYLARVIIILIVVWSEASKP